MLQSSLLELLGKRPLQEITVKDISMNCGISTRTFYNNYSDRDSLVDAIYISMSESCWFEDGRLVPLRQYLRNWAECASGKYRSFFRHTFAYTGQNNIRRIIHDKGVKDMKRMSENSGLDPAQIQEFSFYSSFFLYGLIGIFEEEILPCSSSKKIYDKILEYSDYFMPFQLKDLAEKMDRPYKKD